MKWLNTDDNFLEPDHFQHLQTIMFGEEVPWYYMDNIDYLDDVDKFQFTHTFYDHEHGITSQYYDLFSFIFDKVRAKKLYRIKANLIPRTSKIQIGRYHNDIPQSLKSPSEKYITSILYLNTNNGYTEFENGTKIENVANRFVTFPEETNHRGTSCTDKKVRIVINFNYLME